MRNLPESVGSPSDAEIATTAPAAGATDRAERPEAISGAGAAPARGHAAKLIDAARVLLVGALLGVALAVVRGVPDVEAMHAASPAACSAPVTARPEIGWIAQSEARELIGDADVTFVDARPREAYEAGHVAGALSVPMTTGAIDARAIALVRGSRVVIAYDDTASECASSRRLAELLSEAGLADVRVLRGGMPEWLESGHPAEAGPCRVCP